MIASFRVLVTRHFQRLFRKLSKRHTDLSNTFEKAISILQADPHNRSRRHAIKKLEGVKPGEGQYRLRLGRWRFRYDILGQDVVLHYCGLRREETYG
jgi:mRNA-degrading endonuclease RelE of RelBE toxin-antitoxin system